MAQPPQQQSQSQWRNALGFPGGRSNSAQSIAASFVSARSFGEDEEEDEGDLALGGSRLHALPPPPALAPVQQVAKKLWFAPTPQRGERSPEGEAQAGPSE